VALFCNPASGGTFSSTVIEIIKWVKKMAVAQAKVTHILRPGKASEKTPKGVIPPSLCEISQNVSRKKNGGICSRHYYRRKKCMVTESIRGRTTADQLDSHSDLHLVYFSCYLALGGTR
jgi:hypothetical protein